MINYMFNFTNFLSLNKNFGESSENNVSLSMELEQLTMKKIIFSLFMLALCTLAGAQTIQVGDRFYDGSTLFTVQEIRMGNIVYMTDIIGDLELTLEKWPDQPGKYTLQPSRNAEDAPYGTGFGAHIDYVVQPDNAYLVIYGDNDMIAKVLLRVMPMEDPAAGSLWYNGALVYDASPWEDGSFRMNAMAEGEEHEFVLTPVADRTDLFMIYNGPHDAVNQYESAAYARRIREDGLDVICFYDQQNRLMDVLEATQTWDAEALNVKQWMALLCGEYKSESGKDAVLEEDRILYGSSNIPLKAVTFNGMVTGVLDFGSKGPFLVGMMEAVPTPEGLRLTEVRMNEGEPWFERTVAYFDLKWAGSQSRFAFAGNTLLNGVLHRYDKSLLRFMRNAILASHGYVFKSKDLKTYFEAQPWYHPAASNSVVRLSLLEQLNIALIQAAERQK